MITESFARRSSLRSRPLTYFVDDDAGMRAFLARAIGIAGFDSLGCKTAEEALLAIDPERPGCIVIDLSLPDMDGLALRDRLAAKRCRQPFLVITGHGNVAAALRAVHAGAVDFLEKPLDGRTLRAAIARAVEQDAEQRRLRGRVNRLTPREREILALLMNGEATKPIARQLGISPRTVDVHRHRILKKMQAPSLTHLVRIWLRLAHTENS